MTYLRHRAKTDADGVQGARKKKTVFNADSSRKKAPEYQGQYRFGTVVAQQKCGQHVYLNHPTDVP